jgi:hypothetical protein
MLEFVSIGKSFSNGPNPGFYRTYNLCGHVPSNDGVGARSKK